MEFNIIIHNWTENDGQNAGENEGFARNLARWFENDVTRPECCFVLEEDSAIKGGIAIAASEGYEATVILDLSLSPGSFHLGPALINGGLDGVGVPNGRTACYHLYNDTEQYNDYKQCFMDAGFSVVQEKLSYRFSGKAIESAATGLEFRSYEAVGEDAFLEAVALVSEQTLDRSDANSIAKLGIDTAARVQMEDLKAIDFRPEIWTLAYLGGELTGLVVPSDFRNGYGGIGYIGVVPSKRGRGYINALLREGTRLLLERKAGVIIADTDTLNFPMQNALSRAGYEFAHEMVVLEKTFEGAI